MSTDYNKVLTECKQLATDYRDLERRLYNLSYYVTHLDDISLRGTFEFIISNVRVTSDLLFCIVKYLEKTIQERAGSDMEVTMT